jgi:ABC-type Zn uptake system ZnuABC Zn-binding protein ZnuA
MIVKELELVMIRRLKLAAIGAGVAIVFLLGGVVVSTAASLRAVTTVAPITDIVRRIGGAAVQVHGLVPDGVNSHTFQPTPRDMRYLAEADVVILNGLQLEVSTEKLLRSTGRPDLTILKLGDHTITKADWVFDFSFPESQSHPNPHLWLNVMYAMRYAELIRDQFRSLDPARAAIYEANTERYLRQLSDLDSCIASATTSIPPQHRKLLTYHDSWPYFARRYDMTVIGAIQPANFSEPSAREMARIIRQIQQTQVPAIFGSEVFKSSILEKIADETQVHYVNTLRDDVLPGEPGDSHHSYIGMMHANVRAMVHALGGDTAGFESCVTTLVAKQK